MEYPRKLTIGIVTGGQNLEHEIYLFSSKDMFAALDRLKYNVVVLIIDKSGNWHFSLEDDYVLNPESIKTIKFNHTKPIVYPVNNGEIIDKNTNKCIAKIDVFFPITMEPLKGFFHIINVPYIGPDLLGSAIAMDKDITKRLLRDAGFPTVPYITLRSHKTISFEQVFDKLGLPFFIKPSTLGSSLGIYKVWDESDFHRSLQQAFSYDRKIIIEQAIQGREIECAVMGNENPIAASALCEVKDIKNFFTYESKIAAKYDNNLGGKSTIPADLDTTLAQTLKNVSVSVFKLLECEGLARVDFFLKADGSFFINEIATVPGFGQIYTYPRLWETSEISYNKLMDQLIQLAIDRHNRNKSLKMALR